jgi:hypothetical protein
MQNLTETNDKARGYVSGVERLCREFGLDRVQGGEELVHHWCERRLRWGSSPESFINGAGFGGSVPEVAELSELMAAARLGWDGGVSESENDLRERLLQALDRDLDRIADETAKMGFVVPDTKSELLRDLRWLFWHLRDRQSYRDIAERVGVLGDDPIDVVKKAVQRLAKEIGLKPAP